MEHSARRLGDLRAIENKASFKKKYLFIWAEQRDIIAKPKSNVLSMHRLEIYFLNLCFMVKLCILLAFIQCTYMYMYVFFNICDK